MVDFVRNTFWHIWELSEKIPRIDLSQASEIWFNLSLSMIVKHYGGFQTSLPPDDVLFPRNSKKIQGQRTCSLNHF